MKEILLITSKKNKTGLDFDGGSILVKQLTEHLPNICSALDVVYLRDDNDNCEIVPGIRKTEIFKPPYKSNNKFNDRVNNSESTVRIIREKQNKYDLIIITHISNCFGIEKLSDNIKKKILLFPMFTSESYKKCGEHVSSKYVFMEKLALDACQYIITPSITEQKQLVEKFGVEEKKVEIIPRGIDTQIFDRISKTKSYKTLELLYIAAIRPQKAHYELIDLCKFLLEKRIPIHFNLVGGGESKVISEFKTNIKKNNLEKYFLFQGTLSPSELSSLMNVCHINISVSLFETFSRNIYEGLAKGLPTIVYERISCLWGNLEKGKGIISVDNSPKEMSEVISRLYKDESYYNKLSNDTISYKEKFSEKIMVQKLMESIKSKF